MSVPRMMIILLITVTAPAALAQKFEGLAQTPPMGWNTWNTFASNINEELIHETADIIVSSCMRDAGYEYVVLDDTWSTRERDAEGNLVADPQKFPSGMKALGDYLHCRGLKFGIYNCAGDKTCAGYPGGNGHESADAKLYASWGVDYLKYDWCNTNGADAQQRYTAMRDALHAAGRPVVFSLCEWGQSKPWIWAKDVGHLWRTNGDISACWACKRGGVKNLLDLQVGLEEFAGPGHWNDPDMLEVGNAGLSLAESRAHFSLWCMLAAPLMAGNDVRKMSDDIRAILTDTDVIAIDQDPLGKQASRIYADEHYEVWRKELSGGDLAVCVLNVGDEQREVSFPWDKLPGMPPGTFEICDLWQNSDAGSTDGQFHRNIPSHDVSLLRLHMDKE